MKYNYEAFDRAGRKVNGVLEASEETEAAGMLRKQGLFSTGLSVVTGSVLPEQVGAKAKKPGHKLFGNQLKCLTGFCREVHILMSSGTPLVQCLMAVERQAIDVRWCTVVKTVRERVESGTPLATAMDSHPEYFNAVCRSLVAAGERSGILGAMLERLSILLRKQQRLRSTIVGAMVYPCMLIVIAFSVIAVMLMFVLPRFSELFKTLDSPLPPTTRFLLGMGDWLHSNWWMPMGALLLGIIIFRLWMRRPAAAGTISALALKLPKVGSLVRSLMSAKIARVLGMLLESKLPLVEALNLTQRSSNMMQYAQLLQATEDAVIKGDPMSAVLAESDLIVSHVKEVLRNGEKSGQVGEPLVRMADFLDEENEAIVKTMTSLVEPTILIILGGIVGLMAMSMFLPLFDLVANAGKGAS